MNRVSYRNLVGVCYSEDEAKNLAADITVVDGECQRWAWARVALATPFVRR